MHQKTHGQNVFFGLVEGFCIMTGGCAVGSVSGGMMNPAVAVAWLIDVGLGGQLFVGKKGFLE